MAQSYSFMVMKFYEIVRLLCLLIQRLCALSVPRYAVVGLVGTALAACGTAGAGECVSELAVPAEARSCEMLVEATGAGIDEVSFPAGVIGEWVRQSPRTAIAMHADGDSSMGAGAVTIRVRDGGGYTVLEASCFDGSGGRVQSDLLVADGGCHE